MIGTRLGPYEITAQLGEGGMGVVYRARDSQLGREVALKVLPEELAEDPERAARFEREAQVLASLNHPHIAQVYGLEASGDIRALVLELVEGPTLAERLEKGPLPLDECLSIARQVAEALEEAHERGIVHRDLKPQNVKAPVDGKVKVLDFGLAKALDPMADGSGAGAAAQLTQSPTLTFGATQMGVILGTAAYMAPEQAAGKAVDRRADIWAFGVVLWEMLSGRRLFEGDTVPETLGSVFRQEVSLDELPPEVPSAVRLLIERCLVRDPKLRLRDIGEARIVLSQPLEAMISGAGPEEGPGGERGAGWKRVLPWVVAALSVGVAAAALVMLRTPRPEMVRAPTVAALGIELPKGYLMASDEAPVVDLSRDGRIVVFEADGPSGRQLFRRRLDTVGAEPIDGTEGASQPFLSPDARWVGFYSGSHIRKVPLDGGEPVDLASVNAYRGATWVEGGWIVYTATYSSGLLRVREGGGTPRELTEPDAARNERTHRWPSAVPGTPWVLFSVGVSKSPSFYDDAHIDAVRLDTGERKTLYEGAWMARFAPPRALILQRRGSLFALDFDPETATVLGSERPLLEGVGGEPSSGAGYFAAGAAGTLAYVPYDALSNEKALALVAPDGEETLLPLPAKNYWYPRLSPDGRTLALDIGSGQGTDDDIWLYELGAGRLSRFTFTPALLCPVWSPDGSWIAYGGAAGDRTATIFRKRTDGIGPEEKVWKGHDITLPNDWTPDGRSLVAIDSTGQLHVVMVPVEGGEARELVAAPGDHWGASISPDGRYLAYTTTETGVEEVFVSSLPEGQGKWQVSVDSGEQPVWSRDGHKLFYMRDEVLWEVDVDTRDGFQASAPRKLLSGPYVLRTAPFRNYDVGPDGRFVLVRRRTDVTAPRKLEVLVGWEAKLAPADRP